MMEFVFSESNTTGTGEHFIRKAIERNFIAYFLTSDRRKYAFLQSLPVVTISIDTTDVEKLVEFCGSLATLRGIFSSSEYFVEIANEAAYRLRLPTANYKATRLCRDKALLVEVLRGRGVDVPATALLDLTAPLSCLEFAFPYPLVIKPVRGSGSVDVRLVRDFGETYSSCERIRRRGDVVALAQEYIAGSEYSVETFTDAEKTHVIAVVEKHLGPEPAFVEVGHSYPAALTVSLRERVERCVLEALEIVGYVFGPAHTEVRVAGDRVTIIEMNPRLAGGLIPVMLDCVFDSDVLGHVLDTWVGGRAFPDFTVKRFGAIRFTMSQNNGVLSEPVRPSPAAYDNAELKYFHVFKRPGDLLTIEGDFRDRIAAAVCAGDDRDAVGVLAARIAGEAIVTTTPRTSRAPIEAFVGLPPLLEAIVYREDSGAHSFASDLELLFDLNCAHLIMLAETGLIDVEKATLLLAAHRQLRATGFAELKTYPRPRGLYMMLERFLIETLGEDVGGVLQMGRSRNDINATVTKLKVRRAVGLVLDCLNSLRSTLIFASTAAMNQAFPLFSQYQPALPGTFAHQLLAFEQALAQECGAILQSIGELNVCPLGAGAGGGTTLAIDPDLVCRLAGFDRPAVNSLDAIANRSGAVRFLAALNSIAIFLSRFAQDLQLWTTAESHLARIADSLCGASSMMPQKRNPFLIEYVKGRASVPFAAYVGCATALSKAPYTNSFEVTSQVDRFIEQSTLAVHDMLVIAQALVDDLSVDAERVERHFVEQALNSTALAESLARDGLSFRTSHTAVGAAVREHAKMLNETRSLSDATCEDSESAGAFEWASKHSYGGGPGSATLSLGVAHACRGLAEHMHDFRIASASWREADEMREAIVVQFVGK
jgi:argininosuccinate lyase